MAPNLRWWATSGVESTDPKPWALAAGAKLGHAPISAATETLWVSPSRIAATQGPSPVAYWRPSMPRTPSDVALVVSRASPWSTETLASSTRRMLARASETMSSSMASTVSSSRRIVDMVDRAPTSSAGTGGRSWSGGAPFGWRVAIGYLSAARRGVEPALGRRGAVSSQAGRPSRG